MVGKNLVACHSRSTPCTDTTLPIIALETVRQPLPSTSRQINDKLRRHEPGDRASNILLQFQDGRQWCSKVLDSADHVRLIDVVGLDVEVCESAEESGHCGYIVVDGSEEYGLISDYDAAFEEIFGGTFGGPGYLARVVEVRMHGDLFAHRTAEITKGDEGVGPAIVAIEDSHRADGEAFCRESDAFDVGDREEAFADELKLGGLEVVRVAAGDDDVLDFGGILDVLEHCFPALSSRFL